MIHLVEAGCILDTVWKKSNFLSPPYPFSILGLSKCSLSQASIKKWYPFGQNLCLLYMRSPGPTVWALSNLCLSFSSLPRLHLASTPFPSPYARTLLGSYFLSSLPRQSENRLRNSSVRDYSSFSTISFYPKQDFHFSNLL